MVSLICFNCLFHWPEGSRHSESEEGENKNKEGEENSDAETWVYFEFIEVSFSY